MQSFTSRSTPLNYVGGLLLAYALVISLFAPFGYKPVLAYSTERNHGKENAASVSRKLMTPQRSGRRDGEVLVRFRGSASETEKDTIVLSHGARRNKKLRGESGIEKLELSAGQDAETVAAQLRLNPAVELRRDGQTLAADESGRDERRLGSGGRRCGWLGHYVSILRLEGPAFSYHQT